MTRLKRVDCSGPGILRRRRGRGFQYLYWDGSPVSDPETLRRIGDLAVPPAWRNVWICAYANGHLQAVGTDAAGRRQYLYHERWRLRRDEQKFEHMLEFGRALPQLRETCALHLSSRGLGRDRVLACATRLLDRGFFRIGTEGYAEQNQTYGLATMRKSHVTLDQGVITFDYVAKGGQRRIRSIVDADVFEVVAALKRRRKGGPELLAYKQGRAWVDVKSADINDYIQAITGADFTAKDFRTWNATVLAAVAVAMSSSVARTKTARSRAISRAVEEVAHYLGNTPAVCRKSYIDPRVFDRYLSGWTIAGTVDVIGAVSAFGELSTHGPVEAAVLDLLENRRSSPALEKSA